MGLLVYIVSAAGTEECTTILAYSRKMGQNAYALLPNTADRRDYNTFILTRCVMGPPSSVPAADTM